MLGPTIGGILLASNLTLPLNFLIFAIPGVIAAFAVFLANQQGRKVMADDQKLKKVAN